MADLSQLNKSLQNLSKDITLNNKLLERQAATKKLSDRLEKSRKLEEQREAERRKRLEGSGGSEGGSRGSDGSGIPGGTKGFFSRLLSGKIGLALLGIGGFAAIASKMGGGGNALRKLLDSTIGVLLKIVQEVAAMTADFIGATQVGKSIRNFDLQEYINKALNWLYDPEKQGAEAWFGGIPAKISKLYEEYFTEENKTKLTKAIKSIFNFIYDGDRAGAGKTSMAQALFGGIFVPVVNFFDEVKKAWEDTSGTGWKKVFNFLYDPEKKVVLGGLFDDAFKSLQDMAKGAFTSIKESDTAKSIKKTITGVFQTIALFFYDFFTNLAQKAPEYIYNQLSPAMKKFVDIIGLTPEIAEKKNEIVKLQEQLEAQERIADDPTKGGTTRMNAARAAKGLKTEIETLQGDIDQIVEGRKRNQLLGRSSIIDALGGNSLDMTTPQMRELAEKYITDREGRGVQDQYKVVEDKDAQGNVVGYVAGGIAYPKEMAGQMIPRAEIESKFNEKVMEAMQVASSVKGFHSLNKGAQLALIDMAYNMGPAAFNRFGSGAFFDAVAKGDTDAMMSIISGSKYAKQVGSRARYNMDLIDPRTPLGQEAEIGAQIAPIVNTFVTDNSVNDNSSTSVSGSSGSNRSSSGYNLADAALKSGLYQGV